jgi:hypothetical protein
MKFRDYIEKNAILKMSGLTPDGDTVDVIQVGYYTVSEEEFKKDNRYTGWMILEIHVFDNDEDYILDVFMDFVLNREDDSFIVEVKDQYQLLGMHSKEEHLKMAELFDLLTIHYNSISFSVSDMLKSGVKENEIKKYS